MLTKRKKSGGITQNALLGATADAGNATDTQVEPIDIPTLFKLDRSKTQTKAGRKFLFPTIFQKIDN